MKNGWRIIGLKNGCERPSTELRSVDGERPLGTVFREGPIGRASARPIGKALLASGARQEGRVLLSRVNYTMHMRIDVWRYRIQFNNGVPQRQFAFPKVIFNEYIHFADDDGGTTQFNFFRHSVART
jgi:hypothetical protein